MSDSSVPEPFGEVEIDMDSMDDEEIVPHPRLSVLPNADNTVAEWRQLMENGKLTEEHFKNYWRITVPRIYTPESKRNCLDMSFDEDKAAMYLLRPLERFMCGGEPSDVLQKLSQLDRPPSVCGRVFKHGEPAYSCRECGMDNTCVLCVDCFKRSSHRNHKYKMGTSSGGGCCDCGDTEAWKRDPFCDTHIVGTLPREETEGLPTDLSERTSLTMSAILNYCYRLLTMNYSPELPCDMKLKNEEKDPLQILDQPDTFCTVLYNDETHTFEQVITTLTRVMKCPQRDAIEYVTTIDREGRAIVKCSDFQHCMELQSEIERFTARHGNRSLKVLVLHSHVLAHQIFTMKLLQWLQTFLAHVEGFRSIFTEVALRARPPPDACIAEAVMLRDCRLWKASRTAWHRLLISGMLMDCTGKRALATVFTKHYASVMKEFIRDDHDHSFSISSLSVQMYTVPTLAHHLISNEDALFMLFNTFTSECWKKCNKEGRLEFDRSSSNAPFKRAQYILYDVKYLLSCVPDQWTDPLKKGFLHGVALLLNLLSMMQGMDAVSRQVGQHMEFEPEWESAFNLHIKLANVITLALRWCGGDRIVLAKAYRATIRKITEGCPSEQQGVVKELADHSASVIPYDVTAQPVSIHLPLSRFLAGLHLQLEKHGLSFDSEEFHKAKPPPEEIIEPVLRTAAMIAQVHSGMWRRNGYALLNQLYFYHNVKCRPEMLDRDIVLLQVGASLIESNEFLIHVLNKFGLLAWAAIDFEATSLKTPEEDSMRQTISLVEEFLGLMITIIGERYMPGVGTGTAEDRIKKEIIQQLCVRPMSHSELNKTLPEDELHETGMEAVIEEIAEFKKPAGQGKGVYTLKPHLYDQYDAFFYHYTREELSRSEEEQRKRRKNAGLPECCPPPLLPALAAPFTMIANLVQCDVMLHIIQTILERGLNLRARSFSETQLHKVLHIIGYALHDEESGRYPFLAFTERAAKIIPPLLEELATSMRVEAHRALINWTLSKFRTVASKQKEGQEVVEEKMEEVAQQESVEPAPTAKDSDKEWRAKMAALKRAKVMAQIRSMQNNFMKENAKLFEKTETEQTSSQMDVENQGQGDVVFEGPNIAILGKSPNAHPIPVERPRTCILCQEDAAVGLQHPPLVLVSFIQQSTVLIKSRATDPPAPSDDPLFIEARIGTVPHVSTCGHVMHGQCWQKYFDNVRSKEERRPYRHRQPASFDVGKSEFLCPLCERLSNTALPLLPSLTSMWASGERTGAETECENNDRDVPFQAWIKGLNVALKFKVASQTVHTCDEQCGTHCRETGAGEYLIDLTGSEEKIEPPVDSYVLSQIKEFMDLAPAKNTRSKAALRASAFVNAKMGPLRYYAYHARKEMAAELGGDADNFTKLFDGRITVLGEKISRLAQQLTQAMHTTGTGFSATGATTSGSSGNSSAGSGDARAALLTWRGTAATLLATSQLLAAERRPLLHELSARHRECLQALIRLASVLGASWPNPEEIGSHALRLTNAILNGCPLQWDAVGLLVPLVITLPALFTGEAHKVPIPEFGILSLYTVQLVLLSQITKILIVSDYSVYTIDEPMEGDEGFENKNESTDGCTKILEFYKIAQRNRMSIDNCCPRRIWGSVKESCRDFLRCACLLFHFMTDVPPPQSLTVLNGDTYEAMCAYLGLPDGFDALFDGETVLELFKSWTLQPEVDQFLLGELELATVEEPRQTPSLVTLPVDYSELINTVSLFTCPNSELEDSRNPTMCLICGEMLCSQSYCCQTEVNKSLVGACMAHAAKCGAGAGIFLRVRDCETLLMATPSRGCVLPAPYLDEYGETDPGLRRGNPLRLCQERYENLRLLWLAHGIHEKIARSADAQGNVMSTTWQHL